MIGDISNLITKDNYQLSNFQNNKINFSKFLFLSYADLLLTLKFGNKLHYLGTEDPDSYSENVKTR